MSSKFRRPAMLEPEDAEAITGDYDPADSSDIAHTSAQLLMGIFRGNPTEPVSLGNIYATPDELRPKIREIAGRADVDLVAELWSRQPSSTLPGTLWRLYLLREWLRRDFGTLNEQYLEGLAQKTINSEKNNYPSLEQAQRLFNQTLMGPDEDVEDPGEWLGLRLRVAAEVLQILATAVVGAKWITDKTDSLAHQVTLRESALTKTANEMQESATLAVAGKLL